MGNKSSSQPQQNQNQQHLSRQSGGPVGSNYAQRNSQAFGSEASQFNNNHNSTNMINMSRDSLNTQDARILDKMTSETCVKSIIACTQHPASQSNENDDADEHQQLLLSNSDSKNTAYTNHQYLKNGQKSNKVTGQNKNNPGRAGKQQDVIKLQTIRREIETHRICLHPFVKAQIERWEKHEQCKYTAFGHHKFSSAVSITSVANMSKTEAQEEISRCKRRNASQRRGFCCCVQRIVNPTEDKTWLLNFKQLLVLNTTANWLDYMQIKATEMEGMRLDMLAWSQQFNSRVAELELAANENMESQGNSERTTGLLIGANTPFQSKQTSQVNSAITSSPPDDNRGFQTEKSVGMNRAIVGFPLRLKVIKEQLSSQSHPVRNLITEFTKAFIYLNRYLLYTERSDDEKQQQVAKKAKEIQKSIIQSRQGGVNHLSESQVFKTEKNDHERSQNGIDKSKLIEQSRHASMEDSRAEPSNLLFIDDEPEANQHIQVQNFEQAVQDGIVDEDDGDDTVSQMSMEEGQTLNLDEIKKERARCIVELKTFILVIQETLIEVYGLQEQVRSRINNEQLENFVTALLLSGPIYIFIYNLISLSEYDKLQKLDIIVQNAQVNLANLQVKEVFQLNEYHKATITGVEAEKMGLPSDNDAKSDFFGTDTAAEPYEQTIEHLKSLPWEQSPIAKIDLIYQALKFTLAAEVDAFWEDTERFLSKAERNIDIDNLQGITIYIVWAVKNPSILIDCLITSEFLSKGTKLSTRTLFLEVLRSSIDFLLDIQVDQNPQEDESKSRNEEYLNKVKQESQQLIDTQGEEEEESADEVISQTSLTKSPSSYLVQTMQRPVRQVSILESQKSQKSQSRTNSEHPSASAAGAEQRQQLQQHMMHNTAKTPIRHGKNKTALIEPFGAGNSDLQSATLRTPASNHPEFGFQSMSGGARMPAASIDSRRYRYLENSIRGMTIFRQKFNQEGTVSGNGNTYTTQKNSVHEEPDKHFYYGQKQQQNLEESNLLNNQRRQAEATAAQQYQDNEENFNDCSRITNTVDQTIVFDKSIRQQNQVNDLNRNLMNTQTDAMNNTAQAQFIGGSFAGEANQAQLIDNSALDETRDLLNNTNKRSMKDRRQPSTGSMSKSYAFNQKSKSTFHKRTAQATDRSYQQPFRDSRMFAQHGNQSGITENLFDQNLIDMLKTDKFQLRSKRALMRISKSIHVTTDNSFDDKSSALRFDTLADNRSDSMTQKQREQQQAMWKTTAKKSERLNIGSNPNFNMTQMTPKQITTVELTQDAIQRPQKQRLLLHAAQNTWNPGRSAAHSSSGRQTLSHQSPKKLSFETPQRHLPNNADPYKNTEDTASQIKRSTTHNYEPRQSKTGKAVVYSSNEFDMIEATASKRTGQPMNQAETATQHQLVTNSQNGNIHEVPTADQMLYQMRPLEINRSELNTIPTFVFHEQHQFKPQIAGRESQISGMGLSKPYKIDNMSASDSLVNDLGGSKRGTDLGSSQRENNNI